MRRAVIEGGVAVIALTALVLFLWSPWHQHGCTGSPQLTALHQDWIVHYEPSGTERVSERCEDQRVTATARVSANVLSTYAVSGDATKAVRDALDHATRYGWNQGLLFATPEKVPTGGDFSRQLDSGSATLAIRLAPDNQTLLVQLTHAFKP